MLLCLVVELVVVGMGYLEWERFHSILILFLAMACCHYCWRVVVVGVRGRLHWGCKDEVGVGKARGGVGVLGEGWNWRRKLFFVGVFSVFCIWVFLESFCCGLLTVGLGSEIRV